MVDEKVQVHELFSFPCGTKLWVAQTVIDEIVEFGKRHDHNRQFLMSLERYAKNGFWNYERDKFSPIRHEWGRVYRIGIKKFLLRVYGFYESEDKKSFISTLAFVKKDTSLTASERSRINEKVVLIYQNSTYLKVPNGDYPRFAE